MSMDKQPHLLVCISAHGFGHVAQVAPVLNALGERMPDLRLTVRTTAPLVHLQSRIRIPFNYVRDSGDIGMLMSSALDVRARESFDAYHTLHRDWGNRVMHEAMALRDLAPDFVLSNVGYLPLAGAYRIGVPSAAMCSLNWVDIFEHYCGMISGAHHITSQMRVAYNEAESFLRLTPGMPMKDLYHQQVIGPVAEVGRQRRDEINARLNLIHGEKLVLVSLGGIPGQLPMDTWPRLPGGRWLVPADWRAKHPDAVVLESLGLPFSDILASSDALICKPGYGSFVEAACAGVPVLYVRREDWPETQVLTQWLAASAVSGEVEREALESGTFAATLETLLATPKQAPVTPSGISEAANWLAQQLRR